MAIIPILAILAAQAKPDPWKPAFLPGGFSIQCPGPVKRIVPGDGDEPMPPGYQGWMVSYKDAVFAITLGTTQEIKQNPPDQLLAGTEFGLLEGDGTITAQKDILLNGWTGVEFDFSFPSGVHGTSRAYVVGGSIVQAAVEWPGAEPAADVSRFLGSMMTPDKAGRGPYKHAGPDLADYKLEGAKLTVRLPAKPARSEVQIGTPEIPGKLIRFTASYGNRQYLCVYTDMPTELIDLIEPGQEPADHEEEMLQDVNDSAMTTMTPHGRHDLTYLLGKHKVLSSTAKMAHGGMVRVDSFVDGTRVYSLMSLTPEVLGETDEVKGFFKSMKLDQ